MKQRPVAIGMFVCEHIVFEEKTRNVTLVNCFSRRSVKEIPSRPIPFVVFALLADGMGEMPLEVRIQRLDNLDLVARISRSARFDDPLHEMRCVLRFPGCSFPVAGHYEFVLLADEEPIALRRIVIIQETEQT